MQIKCPNCQTDFELDTSKLPNSQTSSQSVLEPIMTVIEETDTEIKNLVTKEINVVTPSVGDVDKNTYQEPLGDYWKQEFAKEIIVLHFTAGYTWESAYSTFKKPDRVATPFIIDTKGPKYIVKLFDEKYWSYHLGIKGVECKDWINDKRSIGIEIVNIGPVFFKDNSWKDYVDKVWTEDSIIKGKNRDADGGVKFPDGQVEAVCQLVNFLCNKWNISKKVPKDKMSLQLPQMTNFKGIVTHQMFRQDKYDMGVSWPWSKMIELCGLEEVDV